MLNEYIINQGTLYFVFNKDYIFVQEKNANYKIKSDQIALFLNKSCLYYGSTLTGRLVASRGVLKEKYKLPIMINNYQLIIFSTGGQKKANSTFFVYNNIVNFQQLSKAKILVEFKGGITQVFNISYNIFYNQILKASRLLAIYNARWQ